MKIEKGPADPTAMLQESLREVLALISHTEFNHDTETAARKCNTCKTLLKARNLLAVKHYWEV